jgi:hypothetical protein
MTPVFSLCHPTARVNLTWEFACTEWFNKCANPAQCEYVLGIHRRQSELPSAESVPAFDIMQGTLERRLALSGWPKCGVVVNDGAPTMVNNGNNTVRWASAPVIVSVNDDLFPCEHWDERLLEVIGQRPLNSEFVVKVSIASPDGTLYHDGLITHAIVSRAYCDRIGPVDPRYLGYGCDDEFTEHAYRDGVVIEAPDIVFEHRHWSNGGRPRDVLDDHNGRPEVWEMKHRLNAERRAAGFPKVVLP